MKGGLVDEKARGVVCPCGSLCLCAYEWPWSPRYLIGASDLLEISVWGEQNLSRQVSVRTDGFISLPARRRHRGCRQDARRSSRQNLEARLSKFVKDPQVRDHRPGAQEQAVLCSGPGHPAGPVHP
ncbi:MAG: polysaccharide biosynthesis/export family protein [Desulfosudis oleivorans]|nr:polysaccharide biosynthesis/export family protein [Desulfosudis oleivorans]